MKHAPYIYLLVLLAGLAGGDSPDDSYNDEQPRQCEVPYCASDCAGAGAPPRCPAQQPHCPGRCACYLNCSIELIVCYPLTACKPSLSQHLHLYPELPNVEQMDNWVVY